jgi:hypothetical protein
MVNVTRRNLPNSSASIASGSIGTVSVAGLSCGTADYSLALHRCDRDCTPGFAGSSHSARDGLTRSPSGRAHSCPPNRRLRCLRTTGVHHEDPKNTADAKTATSWSMRYNLKRTSDRSILGSFVDFVSCVVSLIEDWEHAETACRPLRPASRVRP